MAAGEDGVAIIYFLSFLSRFMLTYVFMQHLFAAGTSGFKLFLLTIAYSSSSLVIFALVRVKLTRALYPLLSPLLLTNLPNLRLFTAAVLVGLLGIHMSSVLPSLVSRERLGRMNSERAIAGSLGDLTGVLAALFVKSTWLYLTIPLYLLVFLLPRLH